MGLKTRRQKNVTKGSAFLTYSADVFKRKVSSKITTKIIPEKIVPESPATLVSSCSPPPSPSHQTRRPSTTSESAKEVSDSSKSEGVKIIEKAKLLLSNQPRREQQHATFSTNTAPDNEIVEKEKNEKHDQVPRNRAERLQNCLDNLEKDIAKLQEREEKLGKRLMKFFVMNYEIGAVIHEINAKLEDLASMQNAMIQQN
ncbi:hypothetical protein SK128_025991 [Halocaridina rubra]|uniref:Uncharacterized protein n=1 Tax=Halocaridina rubra TaxID=373956 RepID=A0AAN8WWZ1_HALRR